MRIQVQGMKSRSPTIADRLLALLAALLVLIPSFWTWSARGSADGEVHIILTPPGGVFDAAVDVVLGINYETLPAIRYTLDGSDPDESSPLVYPGAQLHLTSTTVVKAQLWGNGSFPAGEVVTATYIVGFDVIRFTPPPGDYSSPQEIRLTTPNASNTVIHYTLNGSEPTLSDPIASDDHPVLLDGAGTIKAFAWNSEYGAGVAQAASYTFSVGSVTFEPPAGEYPRGTTIALASTTPGVSLFYLIEPDATWHPYSAPISITSNTVIYLEARKVGYTSRSASAQFTIPRLPRPEFSPATGPIANGTLVTVTSPLQGATIRYSTDGTLPTETSPVYSGPLYIQPNTRLKARTFHPDYQDSYVRYTYYRAATNAVTPTEPQSQELPHLKFTWISGAGEPVWIANAGDGTGRLFFVERAGNIWIAGKPEPFLSAVYTDPSLINLVTGLPFTIVCIPNFVELLSVAFPPNYDTKAYCYVSYRVSNGQIRVSRFKTEANPDVADVNSLTVVGTYSTDCGGGQLVFAPDGTLYLNKGGPVANPMPASFFQDTEAVMTKMTPVAVESGGVTIPTTTPGGWPFTVYVSSANCATRGGLLYRGAGTRMQGRHFFGNQTGAFMEVKSEPQGLKSAVLAEPTFGHPLIVFPSQPAVPFDISAIGEDEDGRLYVANRGLLVYFQDSHGLPTSAVLGGGVCRVEDDETIFSVQPKLQDNGRLTLEWHGTSGYQHQLQVSEDLFSWQDYLGPFAGTGMTLRLTDLDVAIRTQEFFRVRLIAP